MPLTFAEPPEDGLRLAQDVLRGVAASPDLVEEVLGSADPPESLDVTQPLPVYGTPLEEAGRDLLNADRLRLTGWRYLVVRAGRAVAAVEVEWRAEAGLRPSHVAAGPAVGELAEAVTLAEDLAGDQFFEVRVLALPGLYLELLWLDGAGGHDLLIPVTSPTPALELRIAYEPEAVARVVAELAATALESRDALA
jgi:hypothetical protein